MNFNITTHKILKYLGFLVMLYAVYIADDLLLVVGALIALDGFTNSRIDKLEEEVINNGRNKRVKS